jgi:transposase-like protein
MSVKLRFAYFDPTKPSAFSSLRMLTTALPRGTKRTAIQTWLLKQDSHTLHRPVRKRFPRNSYKVTNAMDVWECDVMDVKTFSKSNDRYRYLLSVIDAFSKLLHIVPLRTKTGTAVALTFRSILAKFSHRRPICVRTERGKEF